MENYSKIDFELGDNPYGIDAQYCENLDLVELYIYQGCTTFRIEMSADDAILIMNEIRDVLGDRLRGVIPCTIM